MERNKWNIPVLPCSCLSQLQPARTFSPRFLFRSSRSAHIKEYRRDCEIASWRPQLLIMHHLSVMICRAIRVDSMILFHTNLIASIRPAILLTSRRKLGNSSIPSSLSNYDTAVPSLLSLSVTAVLSNHAASAVLWRRCSRGWTLWTGRCGRGFG